MRLKTAAISLLVLGVAFGADASTISFRASKKGEPWVCVSTTKPNTTAGLVIQLLIDQPPADSKQVVLKATYDDGGRPVTADLPNLKGELWGLEAPTAMPGVGSEIKIAGTIAGVAITCTETHQTAPEKAAAEKPTPPITSRYGDLDLKAIDWLGHRGANGGVTAVNALLERLENDNPSLKRDDIVLLKHLPSGAPAFPFPSSVSERQVVQIVSVVDRRSLGSVEITLTRCERPQRERLKGDFGALAARPQGRVVEPEFALLPIGPLVTCGPDTMAYTITSIPDASSDKPEPAGARLEVRPVYHLGATAFLGFDRVKKPTFSGKSGSVSETTDYYGTGVLVGATWYPFGVDYGDMKWWNCIINPFVAVSLDAPKDHFVLGTTLTITGGISIAIGGSFHHLDEPDGTAVGAPFTGDGAVPVRKSWSATNGRGLYVGIALDTKIFTEIKKVGGGAKGGK